LLDPKKYQDLALENDGIGYLNFHMILRRLKTKKYGPGKNMIKETQLIANIRNVFRCCEKYFNQDPVSMRISTILEEHFESELKLCPSLKV